MFPSVRKESGFAVSGRNMPKDTLKPEDFVFTYTEKDKVGFIGDAKPSVIHQFK